MKICKIYSSPVHYRLLSHLENGIKIIFPIPLKTWPVKCPSVYLFNMLSCPSVCGPMNYIARQAPLSMGFSRQEYESGWPFPPPGDLPNLGIKPESPGLAGRFFTTEPPVKPMLSKRHFLKQSNLGT